MHSLIQDGRTTFRSVISGGSIGSVEEIVGDVTLFCTCGGYMKSTIHIPAENVAFKFHRKPKHEKGPTIEFEDLKAAK